MRMIAGAKKKATSAFSGKCSHSTTLRVSAQGKAAPDQKDKYKPLAA
jgi:hypothetical protein